MERGEIEEDREPSGGITRKARRRREKKKIKNGKLLEYSHSPEQFIESA